MKAQVVHHLSSLDDEIERSRRALSELADELSARRAVAGDLWIRAQVAETPVADRDFRVAEEHCRRVETTLRREEARLAALAGDRQRVLRRLGGGNPAGDETT